MHPLLAWLILLDCAGLILLGYLPLWINGTASLLPFYSEDYRVEEPAVFIGLLIFVVTQVILRGYQTSSVVVRGWSVRRLALALLITFTTLMLLALAAKVTSVYSRLWFFSWFGSSVVVLPLVRLLIIERVRLLFSRGAYVHRALSVGVEASPIASEEITRMSAGLAVAPRPLLLRSVSDISALEDQICAERIDQLYINVPWDRAPAVLEEIKALRHLSLNIFVIPSVQSLHAGAVSASMRRDKLELHVQSRPIDGWALLQKRVCDIVIASAALLVFAPVMLLVALAIKLESPGPVVFRQVRSGFNGRTFELFKFRSMYSNMTDAGAVRQTSRGDSRVTRVGRFIRRTSLDELPQLFNVLKGDMSVVGPRPHALATTAEGRALDQVVTDYASRHRVRPGMTGWAQVKGLRGELDSVEKLKRRIQYDIEYIDRWSLALDLKVLLRTAFIVLYDPSAY